MNSNIVKTSAPGKIILSGEHAVVYGYPALLSAVDKRLSLKISGNIYKNKSLVSSANDLLEKDINNLVEKLLSSGNASTSVSIDSQIPIGSGMGSSAALAVAFSAASLKLLGETITLEKINEYAYQIEKKQHGNPSGADNTISTFGGFLWYRKESENVRLFSSLKVITKLPKLYILDTGKPLESTKDMVDFVRSIFLQKRKFSENIFRNLENVTKSFLKHLMNEEHPSIADLFRENERLLELLGVVSPETCALVRKIENIGGFAKISGAGGRKLDSGILLVYHPDNQKLLNFSKKNKLKMLPIKTGEKGILVERSD